MQDLKILKSENLKFYFRPNSWDDNVIMAVAGKREYRKYPNSGDTVVDIGSHIGSYTVLCAFMGANVISYEPIKENYQLLKKNLELNKLTANTNNVAVIGDDREVKMQINKRNMGSSRISETGRSVKTVLFDDVIGKHEHIDILKLDCEGEEHKFDIAKHHEKITCIIGEIHDDKKLSFIKKLEPYYEIQVYGSNAKNCYMITATHK